MNNQRRKEINEIAARIAGLQEIAREIIGALESIRDDEQDYFDNMPEGLQAGERGEKAENAISALDDVISDIESFVDSDFDTQLESAAE